METGTREAQTEFHRLAAAAIRAGVLTEQERDIICRRGHRKQVYWARHLLDLRAVLKDRGYRGE
jgi:hypothetical protein